MFGRRKTYSTMQRFLLVDLWCQMLLRGLKIRALSQTLSTKYVCDVEIQKYIFLHASYNEMSQ